MKKFLTITYLTGILISYSLLPNVRTPEQLSIWMHENLTYQSEGLSDVWKTPQQTISDKNGDCEDMAILSQAVLADLKIESQLIYIRYAPLEFGHVICIYKTFEGTYNIFDNQYLFKTSYTSRKEVLDNNYSKWRKSAICDKNKNCSTWTYHN